MSVKIAQIDNYNEAIFNAISEAIIVMAQDGKIVSANKAAYQLFGFEEETLVGQEIEILIPQKFHKIHQKRRSVYAESPHPRPMKGLELSASRSDRSTFPVEVSLNPVNIEGQPCIITIVMDISKRKAMEEQLRTAELLQAQLTHEQEIAEIKNRLVAMFSHELKTPLAVLNTSADLLVNYFEHLNPEKRIHHLELIKAHVEKLSTLLEDVLVISKSGTIHTKFNPTLTNIGEFCQNICIQLGLHEDPQFSCHVEELEDVHVDHELIGHFLINLLTNAKKYTPDDGQITLKVSQEEEQLIFRVSDTGIGIPEEDQAKLFDPFYRANNANSIHGTGLGLTIVETSVHQHKGTIEFTSEVNKGSTFIVKIPLN